MTATQVKAHRETPTITEKSLPLMQTEAFRGDLMLYVRQEDNIKLIAISPSNDVIYNRHICGSNDDLRN